MGLIRNIIDSIKELRYPIGRRFCPVCNASFRAFRSAGNPLRRDAQCPACGALERHRLLWLYLKSRTNLFDGVPKKVLHVAPEICLENKLRAELGKDYVTADLENSRAMVKLDITDITYRDGYFDVIYCSHVLEHVPDDRKAMREFYRVLNPNGWAILLVPITAEVTFEDASVVSPQERLRLFGQEDHVRQYGPDYIDRLKECGFRVQVTTVQEMGSSEEVTRMGLTSASGDIFFCTK